MTAALMHNDYLRFSRRVVGRHFVNPKDAHLDYYDASIAFASHATRPGNSAAETARRRGREHQIQKDERFWVVDTLMTMFHNGNQLDNFAKILSLAIGSVPPFDGFATWRDALGENISLVFEANLPAPKGYQAWLHNNLNDRSLVPWIRDAAMASGKTRLEGTTHVDALLVSLDTGVSVAVEAKVLSDASYQVGYDALRNQIARSIDVLLEPPHARASTPLDRRDPAKTCFVLLTPQIFRDIPSSRLYGWLMNEYRSGSRMLDGHLGHRDPAELTDIPGRLGWLTWEDCRLVRPEACT